MSFLREDSFEDTLKAVRQARAMTAFHNMRTTAERHGFMSDEEIEAEIKACRQEKHAALIFSTSSTATPPA